MPMYKNDLSPASSAWESVYIKRNKRGAVEDHYVSLGLHVKAAFVGRVISCLYSSLCLLQMVAHDRCEVQQVSSATGTSQLHIVHSALLKRSCY